MKRKENIEINKEEIISKKGALSYLQILLLIIGIFAFSYIISSGFEVVSAQGVEVAGFACCEKTKEGAYCQYGLEESCDTNFQVAPTQCEYVDYCRKGCCYSTKTGWCNKATPQLLCTDKWIEDESCNIKECSRGCCVIGRNAIFTTDKNCQVKSSFLGLEKDFRPEIQTELECIFLSEKDEEGACVYDGSCVIDTKEACKKKGWDFYSGKFCSDPSLGTECTARANSKCSDQKVYWYDSCGNREEIKEECSIFAGTTCGLVGTDYKCKSLSCEVKIDGKTVNKKNGESWCEYEGTIGEGKDVAGSRHIRHVCFMGEERVEPCQDYRNQICVQSDTPIKDSREVFSEAACRINNWRTCLNYNTEKDKEKMQEKCIINPDCFVKNVNVDDYFAFPFCAPNYPPGFDVTSESGGRSAEAVCSMGNQKCTVTYVKDIDGWDCVGNCKCLEQNNGLLFTTQMNDLCTSLGDCGAKSNIEGKITDDGYSITRAAKLPDNYLNKFKEYAKKISGQKAQPGNFSSLFGYSIGEDDEVDSSGRMIGGAIGGGALGVLGVALASNVAYSAVGGITQTIGSVPYIGAAIRGVISTGAGAIEGVTGSFGGAGASAPAYGNMFGAGIGAAAGSMLAMYLFGEDLPPNAALITSIASSVVGTIAGMQAGAQSLAGGATTLTAGLQAAWVAFIWAFVIAIIIIVIMELIGIGDTKEKVVEFQCLPWQPPLGGADCEKCNDYESCSDYKCKSLGQTCSLVNKGTKDQKCINVEPRDASSPRIKPMLGFMSEGFAYTNVKEGTGFEIKKNDGECIPEFTNVMFGINTDKLAQCVVGTSPLQTYDEMKDEGGFFGGSNLYLQNHSNILAIPSLEILAREYNLTPIEVKKLGEINMYVKCRGVNGKENDAAYVIKTCVSEVDLTTPYITHASPRNLGYIAVNATAIDSTFYVNEPATCKYGLSEGRYEDMPNSMECSNSLNGYGKYGWPCNATLDVTSSTKFYVKCRDLSENQNTMTGESYIYELQRSSQGLRIVLIEPENGKIIRAGSQPVTVNLEVTTGGGAEDGAATCYYKFAENAWPIRFFETGQKKHKQVFNSVLSGEHKIFVVCEDVALNAAFNSTEFTVYVDDEGPIITRAYYENGLKIFTNEDATCAYSTTDSKCGFSVSNITEKDKVVLFSGTQKEHTAAWKTDLTYYIKCKDEYGNSPGKCSIIIRPYDLKNAKK